MDDRDLGPARQPSTLPPPRERDGPPRGRCSVTLGVEWDARRHESNECVRAYAILAHVPELQGLTARTALQRDRALVRSQGARGAWLNVRMKKGTEPLFAVNMATSLSRLPSGPCERASSCPRRTLEGVRTLSACSSTVRRCAGRRRARAPWRERLLELARARARLQSARHEDSGAAPTCHRWEREPRAARYINARATALVCDGLLSGQAEIVMRSPRAWKVRSGAMRACSGTSPTPVPVR